ncbi:hypothetical protein PWT90_06756 [Aphanocladium album]|nr:hypothetical protein PWT90_06756 [Aphanocladium album]
MIVTENNYPLLTASQRPWDYWLVTTYVLVSLIMIEAMASDAGRDFRLKKIFNAFLHGKRSVSTSHEAGIFFEAARVQTSPPECLEAILASPSGLAVVKSSVRISTNPQFISGHVLPFWRYICQTEAKALCEGTLLHRVMVAVLQPPTAWNAIQKHYVDGGFDDKDVEAFAGLCLEIVTYPGQELAGITRDIENVINTRPFTKDSSSKTRELGYRIQKVLQIRSSSTNPDDADGPGGRHDNDFTDFRHISIYPSSDELSSTLLPFYRQAVEVSQSDPAQRTARHLDNQFRLLREDMLAELRDDISVAIGKKKGKRRSPTLKNLVPVGIDTGDEGRARQCALRVSVGSGLERLTKLPATERKTFLAENRNFLPHQAFGAVSSNCTIIGFAFAVRNIDDLVRDPPLLSLSFCSSDSMEKALRNAAQSQHLEFILVDTPVFAYEPVLRRLREIAELPLDKHLLQMEDGDAEQRFEIPAKLQAEIRKIREHSPDGAYLDIAGRSYHIDAAQAAALVTALQNPLAVIQGPPGTGKSFVGALAAKLLLEGSPGRILVLSYTNHALDQFLEDLLNIGIDEKIITRLGSKSSAVTAKLSFDLQTRERPSGFSERRTLLYTLKDELRSLRNDVENAFDKVAKRPSLEEIIDYLELADDQESQLFWRAFQIPHEEDGFITTGRNGVAMQTGYLLDRWQRNKGPGNVLRKVDADCWPIWQYKKEQRLDWTRKWTEAIQKEHMEALHGYVERFNKTQTQIDSLFNESRCSFIKTKRIIGCTTTAAAKYSSLIKAAEPDYILVEEAGEILEAHVLTALNTSTKSLILIGDHEQLRPKCKNYALSVEKGAGYDLNRSLFERLILAGQEHSTLHKQHRMHPEISQLVRFMTYPDLKDGEKTLNRPRIRGLRGRVAFVNHHEPERSANDLGDRLDANQTSSKENKFEAEMILKTVKYLAQQGYKTKNIVILTPYLGQLRLLRDMLSCDNDPLLSDLDSHELIRAGLVTTAAAKLGKTQIRLSTIDNYQGEESDIVIASLTRSNSNGDIGFMRSPQRLNVLLSRARNGIILFGNMDTFLASQHAADCWQPFFHCMKEKRYLQDGLPVYCEQHPDRTATLSTPQDFDLKCPDGGCAERCDAIMKCGVHKCHRRCHRVTDHSNLECGEIVEKTCQTQHTYKVQCGQAPTRCPECVREEEDIKRRAKRDLDIEKKRLKQQECYRQKLLAIQDEMAHLKLQDECQREAEDQELSLQREREALAELQETKKRQESIKQAQEKGKRSFVGTGGQSPSKSTPGLSLEPGSARYEWECLKRDEGASNTTLDTLMGMIGLEAVKKEFLNIKTTVDTATRQGVSTKNERFGCSFLGNPGTGKTTVARLYAKFLTTTAVIAGSRFEEVTGAKLANMGVTGCQKLLDDMLNAGGGVVFIDEAYQLSSGNSQGGSAVLDFLLAEVENQRSKICFVLAGYAKQMESFFAHNPGIPSRFPLAVKFEDYTDQELLQIMGCKIDAKYGGRMKAEQGMQGLYCRIATRRVGRARGQEGFGNARAVENLLSVIYRRQSDRLRVERREGSRPDDLLLTKEDLLGPEPTNALRKSTAWVKLQELIGLESVKESIKSLVDSVKVNYQRELDEEPIIEYSLNRVFLGNPGTGKTTIAKLYGEVLADLGLLSNGEVVVKNPSDFVGAVIGQSEKQTNGILAATVGKVLVIDEAYGLYGGGAASKGGGGFSDPYKVAVVDTIVANVHSTPGDDRCVLLLGYRDQMEDMFQNVNPGLSRRFPLSTAFTFEDFTQDDISKILDLKLKQQGFKVTQTAKMVALDMVERARSRPNFGNAGEVDILLNGAKARHQTRLMARATLRVSTLEALDFDEDHGRTEKAETNVAQLFSDTIGCERIVAMLQGYQQTARTTKNLGLDPKEHVPFCFIFRGPPGTGKTTTARKMGKVFYDAGFLLSGKVHDCSASDLVGQYVGQTGPKVRQLLDKALGAVLLVDEAYRLREGQFAKEALDELVDCITKERYRKRLIVILAGYENDVNALLTVNPGLTSRFSEVLDFSSLPAADCFELLGKNLLKQKTSIVKGGKGNMALDCMETPAAEFRTGVCRLLERLSELPGWGNARDIETLARSIFQAAMKAGTSETDGTITVTEAIVKAEVEAMAREREGRSRQTLGAPSKAAILQQKCPMKSSSVEPQVSLVSAQKTSHAVYKASARDDGPPPAHDLEPAKTAASSTNGKKAAVRDAGVSDEVWDQLQRDTQAERQREEEYKKKQKLKVETRDDALRKRIIQELIKEEEERKKQAEARKKLQMQGRCPAGYEWIRQAGGWRCAGGSHFISDGEL